MAERRVVVERGKMYEKQPAPKNVIIEYEKPPVQLEKCVSDEGVQRADPNTYLSTRPFAGDVTVVDKINDLPQPNAGFSSFNPSMLVNTRSYTPSAAACAPNVTTTTMRSKTSLEPTMVSSPPSGAKGPASFVSPWRTTYQTSYSGRGFGNRN